MGKIDHIIYQSSEKQADFIKHQLINFNHETAGFPKEKYYTNLNYNIKDESNNIIAGINSILYYWNMLYIDILFVNENYRKKGLGGKLLKTLETEAIAQGAELIYLDTFDFQAKDFYIKNGYEIFGVLENSSKIHTSYCLRKRL